jgi:hypothetical protein
MAAITLKSITQQVLKSKSAVLQNAPASILPGLAAHQPADAHPFQVNSSPALNYLAPGAGTVQLLSYQVPQGLAAFITSLVIVAIGGGFSDFSGNVIWRCWINNAGVDGLENISAHMGDLNTPVPVQILLTENDLFFITAEVPGTEPPMPAGATTAARIQGWAYPLAKVQGK